MNRQKRIERNLMNYVGTVTHTGTKLENNNQVFYKQWFGEQEYLRNNPDHSGFYKIANDYLDRTVPWCLLKGEGSDTIVLIHHSDIVDTDVYGPLKDLAYFPEKLMEKLREGKLELTADAKKDLDSGEWLFGRGVADMKGGAAIHLALLEEYMDEEGFKGNLVFIAVPDEENLSAGMRGAIPLLKELKEKHGLDYVLMLNVEPHDRDNPEVQTFYDGSVGKLMPVVYVRGKLTHVGHIFQGFNPVNLLAEIVRRTEVNPEFLERVGNTVTPPPTWLYSKDRKEVYDVSLPMAAAGYMSILPLAKPPKEIFEAIRRISEESFDKVIEDLNSSYAKYLALKGEEVTKLPWKTNVRLYGELYKQAVEDSGESFTKAMEEMMKGIKQEIQDQKLTTINAAYRIIEKTLEHVNDMSPMVVIALAPPYYPSTNNLMLPDKKPRIDKGMEAVEELARNTWGQECYTQNYFTGISDLSYAMFEADKENIGYIEDNMMLWNETYYIPLDTIKELSMPVINLGPWGKDYHKYMERVFMQDLYDRTPKMVDKLIRTIFG